MHQLFNATQWDENFSDAIQAQAISALETGHVLLFPALAFSLNANEMAFLSPQIADKRSKNIGYHSTQNKLWGVQQLTDEKHAELKKMMRRFASASFDLVKHLFPHYAPKLQIARTSFRPVQVSHRKTSYRKDDKRLHVDAFPSSPNQGKRILRVFCNINPHQEDRVWRVGEPFEHVAERFLPGIKKPFPGSAALLRILKMTKSRRAPYDHYMLELHNRMKADERYQREAPQEILRFPPGSTWIAQTDQVSHAAMSGQYLLEQTFSLPVCAMQNEALAPLRVLERLLGRRLVRR